MIGVVVTKIYYVNCEVEVVKMTNSARGWRPK